MPPHEPSAAALVQQLQLDARSLGVPLDAARPRSLLELLDELSIWNRAYSLTAITERAAMIRAHLLDSLSAYPDLAGTRIADVGTGAGFPGLPLALSCREREFTLIDSVAKRFASVAHAARQLALTNVTPLRARVRAALTQPPFDTVIARAYAALPELLAGVQGLSGPHTRVIALKGHYPHEELAQLPPAWRLESVRAVQIPGLSAARHIVRLVPQA